MIYISIDRARWADSEYVPNVILALTLPVKKSKKPVFGENPEKRNIPDRKKNFFLVTLKNMIF